MSSLGLIVVVVLIRGTGSFGNCPSVGCQCKIDVPSSTVSISCDDANLTHVPFDLLRRTASLVSLHLTGNSLGHLMRGSVPSLLHMTDLQMKSNSILSLDISVFAGCKRLKTLDLSNNNLTVLASDTFRGLDQLLHLDLSANQLERIDGSLNPLQHLARLDLRQNYLSMISEETLRGLARLRYLRLDDNRIHHIDSQSFHHLKKLFYLVLKGNPIHGQPRFHFATTSLSYLDMSNCHLAAVPVGLPSSIEYLHLGANKISVVRQVDFARTTEVKILVLDDNGMISMETGAMATMHHLQQLWLNGNQLTTVPRPLPKSLQRLFMDHNAIRELTLFHFSSSSVSSSSSSSSSSSPSSVSSSSSWLSSLSLMGNQLERISPQVFRQLPQLNLLDLSGNQLMTLGRNSFVANRRLQILILSKNPLQLFQSDCFRGLQSLLTLSLSFVASIKVSLHSNVFNPLSRLRKLDMDSSPELTRSVFSSAESGIQSLVQLQELSVRKTDLTQLPSDFPVIFCHLAVFRISSERWQCDESVAWLRDWLQSTQSEDDAKDNLCISPASLSGRSVMTISDFELQRSSGSRVITSAGTGPGDEKNSNVKVTSRANGKPSTPRGSLDETSGKKTESASPSGTRLLTWTEFLASIRNTTQNRSMEEGVVTQKIRDMTLPTGYDITAPQESGNGGHGYSMEEMKNVEMLGMVETAAVVSLLLMLLAVLAVIIFLTTHSIGRILPTAAEHCL